MINMLTKGEQHSFGEQKRRTTALQVKVFITQTERSNMYIQPYTEENTESQHFKSKHAYLQSTT